MENNNQQDKISELAAIEEIQLILENLRDLLGKSLVVLN